MANYNIIAEPSSSDMQLKEAPKQKAKIFYFPNLDPEIKEIPEEKKVEVVSLGSSTLELVKPIPVLLSIYENEVIAKFIDVQAVGFGENEEEAIDNLRDNIISLYYELIEDETKLGPLPKKWLNILKEIIKEK